MNGRRWRAVTCGLGMVVSSMAVALPEVSAQTDERRRIQGAVVEPGTASLTLRPLYDGRPVEDLTGKTVHVVLLDRRGANRWSPEARVWNGFIELARVETGVYDVSG